LLEDRGVSTEDARHFADLYQRNPELMADFMMTYEIGMSDPSDGSPALSGVATFLSFVVFGVIPLFPYFVLDPTFTTFVVSVAATFGALVLLGLVRWRVTQETVLRCVTETVGVGGVCAIVAYTVGIFFRL
jgi:VIT1/CCC1 family predicted Fe2+/Mn2+ transporter